MVITLLMKCLGTTVMKITAMDADEPGNINSQIHYEIVDQKPAGAMMFSINQNGEVIVNNPNLDREVRRHTYKQICYSQSIKINGYSL